MSRGSISKPDLVTEWALAVRHGEIVAGPHIRNAATRHLHDLEMGEFRGLFWDLDNALRVIEFFPDVLCLAKGKFDGAPFELEPSQQFIVGSLFGWKRSDTGFRRFRRAYIEQGKGNGKTPLSAGIGMYCMLADGEPGAEVYAAASKKDQAQILFQAAVSMFRSSPSLKARLIPSGAQPVWNLGDPVTGSLYRPISSEGGQSGPIPSCALCDEVHEHQDGLVIEMLERGFKSRRQPLLVMTTNSGSNRNSVCWEEHLNAIQAAAGTRAIEGRKGESLAYVGDYETALTADDTFSFVCSLDDDDDPLNDPECWGKANMLLGLTMPYDVLEKAVSQGRAMPGKLNNILRLHFCEWTDSDKAWISRETLEKCVAHFDVAEHAHKKVYCGADLSATTDFTILAFCVPTGFVERPGDAGAIAMLPTFDLWAEAWTPADTLAERESSDRAQYSAWVSAGWLQAVPGSQIRMDFVAARLATASSEFDIAAIAYDRYAYRKLESEIEAQGLVLPFVEHPQGGKRRAPIPDVAKEAARIAGREPPQGLWMPGSLAMLESLIIDQRIRIMNSPVLISAAMSAVVEEDAFGNRWFTKAKATRRIDAIVAAAMAVGAATSQIGSMSTESVYERRELLVI